MLSTLSRSGVNDEAEAELASKNRVGKVNYQRRRHKV